MNNQNPAYYPNIHRWSSIARLAPPQEYRFEPAPIRQDPPRAPFGTQLPNFSQIEQGHRNYRGIYGVYQRCDRNPFTGQPPEWNKNFSR
jgi:hypothetical protein